MTGGWRLAVAAGALALAAAGSAAVRAAPPSPSAAALTRGQQVYARCAACHAIGANRTGPQHCGLWGRRAGQAPGFDGYSLALRQSGIVWNTRSLDAFLKDPMSVVPGTSMGYSGVKDDLERADLLAWMQQATRAGAACTVEAPTAP